MTEQLFFVDSYVQTKNPFDITVRGKPVPTMHVAWHIIEVNAQTCSAGTQYWYICRPHLPEQNRYDRSFRDWAGNELRKFNQIELERYTEPEPEPEDDKPTAEALMEKIIKLVEKGPAKE